MRILLAFAGKNGTTAACVERLQGLLKGRDVTVADLDREHPRVADFDIVAVGSSVRFGKLMPSARRFLKDEEQALTERSLALFLCCGLAEEQEYYREKLFSEVLREHAFANAFFGGSLKTEGLPFFDKLLVKSMRSRIFEENMDNGEYIPTLPSILPENIDRMASQIRGEIARLADV